MKPLEQVGYVKALVKNCVCWRVVVDALCCRCREMMTMMTTTTMMMTDDEQSARVKKIH